MARIRHIALYSDNPEKEASFYRQAFGLKEVRRSESGSVFLSDGYINLALLKSKGESEAKGLHHFGFQVESITQLKSGCAKSNLTSKSSRRTRE